MGDVLTFRMTLFALLLFSHAGMSAERLPDKCSPCSVGEGHCRSGSAEIICLVDSKGVCPGKKKKRPPTFFMKIKNPKTCSCEKPNGKTKVTCILP